MPGKIVVITGACGQLGRAFTATLLKQSYQVHALDVKIQEFMTDKNLHYHSVDITDEKQVIDFFKTINSLQVLVNNAGMGVFTPSEKRTADEFRKVMDVNLLGTFLMCRESIAVMKRNGGGKIVNLGSIYGVISSDPRIYGQSGRNNSEVYSATKAGVIHMTKYLAANYAKDNIQVNCISPGGVFNQQSEDFVENYIFRNPSSRMGRPEDLQSALKFLISEESGYVTGQNVVVDGGHTAW